MLIYHYTKAENLNSILKEGLKARAIFDNGRLATKKNPGNLVDNSICFTPIMASEENSEVLSYGNCIIAIEVDPEKVFVNDQEDLGKINANKEYNKCTLAEYNKMSAFDKNRLYPYPEIRIPTQIITPDFVKIIKYEHTLPRNSDKQEFIPKENSIKTMNPINAECKLCQLI
jgi:hypothetical protein